MQLEKDGAMSAEPSRATFPLDYGLAMRLDELIVTNSGHSYEKSISVCGGSDYVPSPVRFSALGALTAVRSMMAQVSTSELFVLHLLDMKPGQGRIVTPEELDALLVKWGCMLVSVPAQQRHLGFHIYGQDLGGGLIGWDVPELAHKPEGLAKP